MDWKELNKVFAKGSAKERKSVYIHKPIIDAINEISDKTGKDFSELVCFFLDKQLTELAETGFINLPDAENSKEPSSKKRP